MKKFLKLGLAIWIGVIGLNYLIFDPFNIWNSHPLVDIGRYIVLTSITIYSIYLLYNDKIGYSKYVAIGFVFILNIIWHTSKARLLYEFLLDDAIWYRHMVQALWSLIVVLYCVFAVLKFRLFKSKLSEALIYLLVIYSILGVLSYF
jgi:hypothetical protein